MADQREEVVTAYVIDASAAVKGAQEAERAASRLKAVNENLVLATERVERAMGLSARQLDALERRYAPASAGARRLEEDKRRLAAAVSSGGEQMARAAAVLEEMERAERAAATAAQRATEAMVEQARAAQVAADAQMRFNQQLGVGGGGRPGAAAQSASAFEEAFRAAEREAQALAELRERLDPMHAASQRVAMAQAEFAQQTEILNRALERNEITAQQHAAMMQRLQQQHGQTVVAAGKHEAANNNLRGALQQVGFQVGDVATQIASGGSAMQALTVQAGQLLGAFGPWGAVLGAAVTVVGALGLAVSKAGGEAENSKTAYTDYAKALDLAGKASDELTRATGAQSRALEAQRSNVIAAKQAALDKAEADLVAAQAARMNQPMGVFGEAGSLADSGYAAQVEEAEKRFRALRLELDVLRGKFGEYNDGARAVQASTDGARAAAGGYTDALKGLRENLRQQIADLGFQVDAQDRSNAAKLEAKLRSEAMKVAGVAEYQQVDAATRALIEEAVARQRAIDKIEANAKASDRAAAAAKREAEELRQRNRAINAAATDAAKDEEQARAAASKRAQDFIRDRDALNRSLEDEVKRSGELVAISGLDERSRAVRLKQMELEERRREKLGSLSDDERKNIARAAEEMVDNERAVERYNSALQEAAQLGDRAFDALIEGAVQGKNGILDLTAVLRGFGAELLTTAARWTLLNPLKNAALGSNLPTLWSFGAPGGGSAAASSGGGLFGMGGGGIGSPMDFGRLFGGVGTTVNGWAASAFPGTFAAPITQMTSASGGLASSLGVASVPGGVGNAAVAGQSVGYAGTPFTAYLGPAAGGFAAGSLVGGYLGTRTNSKAVGGVSGAAVGAGVGFLVGGPVGAVIGGLAGGAGGMFGTQKASVGPIATSAVGIEGGRFAGGLGVSTDNDGNAGPLVEQTQAMAAQLNALVDAYGLSINASRMPFGGLYSGNGNPWGSRGTDDPAALLGSILASGAISGTGTVGRVLASSKAKDVASLSSDLEFAQWWEEFTSGMTDAEKAVRDITKTWDAQVKKAQELGLATEKLVAARDKEIAAVRNAEQAQKDALGQQAALGVVGGLRQFAAALPFSDLSALAPETAFGLAESRFNAVSGAALAGDFNSLAQLQAYSELYLRGARAQYGSGRGFAEAFNRVADVLDRVGQFDPGRLVESAIKTQTAVNVDGFAMLRDELVALRREFQQMRNAPPRAA
jgi:hypothetical protein